MLDANLDTRATTSFASQSGHFTHGNTSQGETGEMQQAIKDLERAQQQFNTAFDRANELKKSILAQKTRKVKADLAAAKAKAANPASQTIVDLMAISMVNAFVRNNVITRNDLRRDGFTEVQIGQNYEAAFKVATSLRPQLAMLPGHEYV